MISKNFNNPDIFCHSKLWHYNTGKSWLENRQCLPKLQNVVITSHMMPQIAAVQASGVMEVNLESVEDPKAGTEFH